MPKPTLRATGPVYDKHNDPIYVKIRDILTEANYGCIRVLRDVDLNAPEHQFEFWAGPKGVIILQLWNGKNGVHTYINWNHGHTIEELKAAL